MSKETSIRDCIDIDALRRFNDQIDKSFRRSAQLAKEEAKKIEARIKEFEQHIAKCGMPQINQRFTPKILINPNIFDWFFPYFTDYLLEIYASHKLGGRDVEFVRMPALVAIGFEVTLGDKEERDA